MFEYIHFVAFGSPFLVALIVLVWANLSNRKTAAPCATETFVETVKETSRCLSVPLTHKPYAF